MVCAKVVQTRLNEFVDREMAEYWRDMHRLGIHSVNELLELIV
jgi:hypothetical protein